MAANKICEVEGCGKEAASSRGLCSPHYQRWRKHGDPLKGRIPQGEAQRYYKEVVLAYDGDDCLTWPYGRDSYGYGRVTHNGRAENVCRLVCEHEHGPPPPGKNHSAHSCGKGHLGCVSKNHLSWKSPKENVADKRIHGTLPPQKNQRRTAAKE